MNNLNTANLDKFVPVLEKYGFNLKTKALKTYIKNPANNSFVELVKTIEGFGYYTEKYAEVYAIMLLNYKLNGSSSTAFRKVSFLTSTFYSENIRSAAFNKYSASVSAKTFKRWADCLTEIKSLITEINSDNKLTDNLNKPAELNQINSDNKLTDNLNKPADLFKLTDNLNKPADLFRELTLKQIEEILGYKIKLIA